VLLPDPAFPLYQLMLETQHLQPFRYGLRWEDGGEPDWTELARLAPSARVLIWNFPANPSGTVARPEWLERLRRLLAKHPRLHLVSDEVYEDLVFDGRHVSPAAAPGELSDRCFSVFSFSKSFGMTGWRLGYVHAPGDWARSLARAHWSAAMSASALAQHAALAALNATSDYRQGVLTTLAENRETTRLGLERCGLSFPEPEAGFFVWVDIGRSGLDSNQFAGRLLEECAVRVSPGSLFGPSGKRFVRLSFSVDSPLLNQALERLQAWLADTMLPEPIARGSRATV